MNLARHRSQYLRPRVVETPSSSAAQMALYAQYQFHKQQVRTESCVTEIRQPVDQLGCRPAGLLHSLAVPHAALVATNHILYLTPRHWTHICAAHPLAHERQHWCLHAYSGSNRCTQHTHAHADSHPRCSLTRTVGLTPAAPNYVTLPSSTAKRRALTSVEYWVALVYLWELREPPRHPGFEPGQPLRRRLVRTPAIA